MFLCGLAQFFQPIVITLFADTLLRTEFPIVRGIFPSLLHKLPPLPCSLYFSYLHDFCHLTFPFSRKTYWESFGAWVDFRIPFSFVPAVPLLSAYHRSPRDFTEKWPRAAHSAFSAGGSCSPATPPERRSPHSGTLHFTMPKIKSMLGNL